MYLFVVSLMTFDMKKQFFDVGFCFVLFCFFFGTVILFDLFMGF